jgi:hypothetical protein
MIYLTRRQNRLDVYVPEEFVRPFETTLQAMYLIPDRFPFPLHIHGYSDGFEFNDGFKLTAIANRHLEPMADVIRQKGLDNKMQCYSFRIEIEGCKPLFYSSDIGSLEDIKPHVGGCGHVVMELTHVDLDEFFRFAVQAPVDRFVITHLGNSDEVEQLRGQIRSAGLSNVVLGEDGMKTKL